MSSLNNFWILYDFSLYEAALPVLSELSGSRGEICALEKYMKTLRNASVGETLKVRRLNGEGALKRRLMDMGLTNGCEVFVRKVAPLGDPVEITVRGYELSVRRSDAECIEVE